MRKLHKIKKISFVKDNLILDVDGKECLFTKREISKNEKFSYQCFR